MKMLYITFINFDVIYNNMTPIYVITFLNNTKNSNDTSKSNINILNLNGSIKVIIA